MDISDEIEIKSINQIYGYANNPKEHPSEQVDKIASSIKNYGFVQPIVVDDTNEVIIGHGRLKASKKLGLEKVPVVIKDDLNEAQVKALRIADNKVAESEWDYEALAVEFDELDFEDYDLDATGFEEDEIDEIWQDLEPEQEVDEDNFNKEVDEEDPSITELGDVIELGRHRLVCGDSTDEEDVSKLMNGDKSDMVFTDPPYNALKSWNKDEAKSETRLNPNDWFGNDNMSWSEFKKFLSAVFNNFTGHSIYVCCDFRIYDIIKKIISQTKYDLKHCIVWKKNVWGLGKRYRFQHEFIAYACKDKAPFTGDRSQSDVWEVDVDRTTKHKTPKPVKLPAKAIKNSSNEDESVLDLFGGSGSTLIAAEQLDRKCYMMELDTHYCDVIIRRYINYRLDNNLDINIKVNGEEVDYYKFLD